MTFFDVCLKLQPRRTHVRLNRKRSARSTTSACRGDSRGQSPRHSHTPSARPTFQARADRNAYSIAGSTTHVGRTSKSSGLIFAVMLIFSNQRGLRTFQLYKVRDGYRRLSSPAMIAAPNGRFRLALDDPRAVKRPPCSALLAIPHLQSCPHLGNVLRRDRPDTAT